MTLGVTTPFISLWLIEATGHPVAPAFYLMVGAAVSVVAWLRFSRRLALSRRPLWANSGHQRYLAIR
jgi:MHS family proline/betaine transporter-like MFS transporter